MAPRAGVAAAVSALVLSLLALASAKADRPVLSLAELRQQHVVLQRYDISCGAAALATLLTFGLRDAVSERQVALGMMGRSEYLAHPELVRIRQGFSLLDMRRYVQQRGYRGVGLSGLEFADLLQRAPAIVPVRMFGYNHFVVFRGAVGDSVLLADPAFGNRTMSIERFLSVWIVYPELGRVAFTATRRDGVRPDNLLAVSPQEFPVLP
jgi:predicted double-glycine peptidase